MIKRSHNLARTKSAFLLIIDFRPLFIVSIFGHRHFSAPRRLRRKMQSTLYVKVFPL